ncbi:MAG: hypothetical protein JJE55_14100 [Flavobacteriaceae bacterium]|nr:hypothetical protein [Flavobacteriaceae bacterium]
MKKIALFVLFTMIAISCKNNSSYDNSNWVEEIACDGYCDGTYCAEIDYYYDKTGTQSTYTLKVEIEDNELVKIYWPNGGWLDSSHYNPPDISDGYASFESYEGIEYTIDIIGDGDDCYYDGSAQSEDDFIDEENDKICPQCGGQKSISDKYCEDCTDEIENTCSRCGAFQYYVYGGLCDNCQEEQNSEDDF